MKKFILKTVLFFGILLAYLGISFGINRYFVHRPPLLPDAEILVIGDSRMMTAINPEKLPHSVNVAQNSESYLISYHKLLHILPENPGIKKVLIGFAYPSFSAYLDRIFKDDIATADVFGRVYPIMSVSDFGGLEVDVEKYNQVYFKNMFVYPHTNHHKYLGGFSKLPAGLDRADLSGTLKRHYFDADSQHVGISQVAEIYLDSIVSFCKKNEVEIVFVNIPFHPAYDNLVPENFKKEYGRITKKYSDAGILILDYGRLPMDDTDFKDYNHLSFEGANKFTAILAKRLESNESVQY